jgi:AcrR family transcriptional regulator
MTFSTVPLDAPANRTPGRGSDPAVRLVDAARDLADESGSAGFTVAQVAGRAGTSLKAFYRTFAGKDDLLVALLAAESVRGAAVLEARTAAGPADALTAYVEGILELASLPEARGYARVLVQEHRRLAQTRPDELDAALAPLLGLLARITGDARDARTVFSLLLSGIHDVTLGRADARDTGRYLAAFVRGALAHGGGGAP